MGMRQNTKTSSRGVRYFSIIIMNIYFIDRNFNRLQGTSNHFGYSDFSNLKLNNTISVFFLNIYILFELTLVCLCRVVR